MKIRTLTWLGALALVPFLLWGCGNQQTEDASDAGTSVEDRADEGSHEGHDHDAGMHHEGDEGSDEGAEHHAAGQAITYACPMHPDQTAEKPGKCAECGMYLEAQVPEGTKVKYVCDMHDEPVEQDKPGECDQCGMFLTAKIVDDDATDDASSEE